MRAVIFRRDAAHGNLEGRTRRALISGGLTEIVSISSWPLLVGELLAADAPILLTAAGAWLVSRAALPPIPSSNTGKPLIAFGVTRPAPIAAWRDGAEDRSWQQWLKQTGGSLERYFWRRPQLPEPASVYLEPEAARALAPLLTNKAELAAAIAKLAGRRCRAVHLPALDVHFDPRLRILQLVTTIQIGGAERVTLDLAAELSRQGVTVCVAAWGKATRLAFPEPANFADLSDLPFDPEKRAQAAAQLCGRLGVDLVHAHLIRAREAQAIRGHGLPLVMTIHNMPQSWPPGLAQAGAETADLLVACSKTVGEAAAAAISSIPVRTVWNGIDPASVAHTPARQEAGARIREKLGITPDAFVLAAIANPRRQKRLDRLPEILVHLRRGLHSRREVHLLLAGAPAGGNQDAEDAVAALEQAIADAEVRNLVHWTGPVLDIAPILAASDVLVSVSEFEGLSLAHLEGLAAGLPVVATNVGGTAEIAAAGRGSASRPRLHLLPPNAGSEAIAAKLAALASEPNSREPTLPKSFTRHRMARRYADLYARTLERSRRPAIPESGDGLWLITNNFSTGGAQSSARRLLLGLAARGIQVRAAVVQEHPRHPTVGRSALLAQDIPVTSIPPPGELDAEDAVSILLTQIAEDRPRAVVFWNLLASYKLLLADGLLDIPTYDVSPGEMYFESLATHFATPRAGLPYLTSRDYSCRLHGIIVKYRGEAARAEACLGKKAHVIRNGVHCPGPNALARLTPLEPCGRIVFGTAARLAPQKRLEDLLAALRLAHLDLPPYLLRIAGGPETGQEEYSRQLRALAHGLHVEWCGEFTETSAFLQSLDVFVMISEPAGCPNASLEALASGLAIIATDVGGASEQVLDRQTGLLVPSRNPRAFAAAMVEISHSASLRQRLSSNAREHIQQNFSLDGMLDRYTDVLGLNTESQVTRGEPAALPTSLAEPPHATAITVSA